ncbi:MAG: type II toxin-antitoxin system VapC family toxin [Pseudomonadota bacterium]|nr:type II toxin-antitoxin system VapC family toxin [Pseudomonadota bacterium]
MITHVLDTNAVIGLVARKSAPLVQCFLQTPHGAVAIPTIVAHELYYGVFRSQRIAYNLETLRLAMANIPVLDFDAGDAFAAGEIRAALAAQGTPIGPYDALIAGQAKARGLTVVTNNVREFGRVPGLKVEDWTA